MEIKLSRFCTLKGSNQALAYTPYFKRTTVISPETSRTQQFEYHHQLK